MYKDTLFSDFSLPFFLHVATGIQQGGTVSIMPPPQYYMRPPPLQTPMHPVMIPDVHLFRHQQPTVSQILFSSILV